MITLSLLLHSNPRGPGFWKLNTSFLTEIDYVNQIKRTIQETRDEYEDDDSVNPSLLCEMVKLKVHEKSLHFSKIKKKQTNQREKELEQTIAKLEDDLDNRYANDPQLSNLEEQLNKKSLNLRKSLNLTLKVQF